MSSDFDRAAPGTGPRNAEPGADAQLARLGAAFGDATRRDLYRRVLFAAHPLSAGDLAGTVGLHRTVVRGHLEKLVELGFLDTTMRRDGRGGRPAKLYGPGSSGVDVSIPERSYRHFALALLDVLPAAAADQQALARAVEEAGLRAGRAAGSRSLRDAVAWLRVHGYRPSVIETNGETVLELRNCAAGDLAAASPGIVCAYDRSLLCGLLDVPSVTPLASIAEGAPACRLAFRQRTA